MYRLPFELTDSAKLLPFTILGGGSADPPCPPPLNDATAYMSFATATAWKISCSESSHNPRLRRTRSAYRVCAQAAVTLCTCNVTDRLLLNVTPRILIVCTRWSSGILSGIENTIQWYKYTMINNSVCDRKISYFIYTIVSSPVLDY